jgi:3-oxoacyl-[acyl-carrier-protein] synthase-3
MRHADATTTRSLRYSTPPVSIAGVSYWLPPTSVTARELETRGLLRGSAATLETFGFCQARVATSETHVEMAINAARAVLDETTTDPSDVDVVLYAGALSSSATMAPPRTGPALQLDGLMDLFKYPASYLQSELDLTNAVVSGVGQQGCASLFSALRQGRDMLIAEPDIETVLCVGADRLPPGAHRDVVYNLVSDGACAALLRRGGHTNRIVTCHQITKGAMWDTGSEEAEVIATYFPTARTVIADTLGKAGIGIDDIALIIPHNVSLRSWEILIGMLECPREKLFSTNIGRLGHTIAADNLINLRDVTDAGLISKGDLLLLFTFGFGLNWSCMVLEH